MQTQPITFTGSNKNTQEQFTNGINYTCLNGIIDELGNLTRRPGLGLFIDLGTSEPVIGLFYSSKQNITVAVSGQQIFLIQANGTFTDITGAGIPELGNMVTFGDFGDTVYCANGGRIITIPLTSDVINLSDGSTDLWSGSQVPLSDGSTDLWTDSPTTPGEYYYTGSDAPIAPDSITAAGVDLPHGVLGGLLDGEYAWGDQDSLGSETLYVKVAVGDPDGQVSGYIKAVFGVYYYTGSSLVAEPTTVTVGGVDFVKGTLGSLINNEYAWGDDDSLGFDTLYIKLATGDPDDQSAGYVTALNNRTFYIQDSSAPTQVTHVAVLNQKLIANNKAFSARFEWSDVGKPYQWSGSFATAEGQEDGLNGLYVEDERITLFGKNTTERWRDDGSTPFVPESQEYVQRGSITQHSPAFCRDRWIWLDEYKQLVALAGRSTMPLPQQNSRGLTGFLQGLDISDARGRFILSNGRFYYMGILPKAGKSFFFDIDKDEWYETSYWNTLKAEDEAYRAFSSTYAFGSNWGQMLIGDSKDGKIYSFDAESFTDNGEIIRTVLKTGFIDRGTSEGRKKTSRISGRITIENLTVADPEIKMIFKWRNENTHKWSERLITLYKLSNNQFRWSTVGLGSYFMRQYEFVVTANVDFIMSPPQETFDNVR